MFKNHSNTYAHKTPISLDGAGLHGSDVDSVDSSSDYFAHLCIPESETTLHQKRMSIANRSHLRRQTIETNYKNEPCLLDRTTARIAWITALLQGLSFSNCAVFLAVDFDTPVSSSRRFSDFLGVCSNLAPVSSNFSSVSTRRLCLVSCLLRVPLV
jgi:hypothetical protein